MSAAFNGFGPAQIQNLAKIVAAQQAGRALSGPLQADLAGLAKVGRGNSKWVWWGLGLLAVAGAFYYLHRQSQNNSNQGSVT